MTEILDYNPGDIEIPMFLEEGNLTVTTDDIHEAGTGMGWSLASRIRKGDYVVIYASADRTVQKAGAGVTELLGRVIDEPAWVGNRPTTSQTSGNFQRRVATVRILGAAVFPVELEATNSAITVGKSIKPGATTASKFDLYHATNLNNTRVLQAAASSSGAKIAVVFGFTGNLA